MGIIITKPHEVKLCSFLNNKDSFWPGLVAQRHAFCFFYQKHNVCCLIYDRTGERCSLTFKSCGLFGKELHKVEGYILDKR